MAKHNILKLAQAVEKLPPSQPRVVTAFLEKVLPLADKRGELTDEQVIEVVDNWPNGCQDGRDRYLASVGVTRPVPPNVLKLAQAAFVLLDGGTFGPNGAVWSAWDYGNDLANIKPCVHGLKPSSISLSFGPSLAYKARDVSINLDRVKLEFDSVHVDTDGRSWLLFKTPFVWERRGPIGVLVPVGDFL